MKQNAALVEQSAAAAESLKEQATRLAAVVSTFRLAEGDAGPHNEKRAPRAPVVVGGDLQNV